MTALAAGLCPWLADDLRAMEQTFADDRLGHGWIIAGPPDIGKLNLAAVLATRILSGEAGGQSPAEMDAANLVAAVDGRYQPENRHPDLHLVWPEEGKRSITVDDIRALSERIRMSGYAGDSKFVVMEPAEAMTMQAANALLKSLEEPGAGTYFLLVSHCPGRLPATIRSRCQVRAIRAPDAAQARRWLGLDGNDEAHPLFVGDGVGPVAVARRRQTIELNNYKELDNLIQAVVEKRIGAGEAVDRCARLDKRLVLEWLTTRAMQMARSHAKAVGSNSITDRAPDLTENPFQSTSLSRLLDLLSDAQALGRQQGSGMNDDLALEVMLGELSAD